MTTQICFISDELIYDSIYHLSGVIKDFAIKVR